MKKSVSAIIVLTALMSPMASGFGLIAHAQTQTAGETEIEQFCSNLADNVRESRFRRQKEELEVLRDDIEKRIVYAETKVTELKEWVRQREQFSAQATQVIIDVYGSMRPRGAAERMQEINPHLASAVLLKLKPRTSAAILTEMETSSAARITQIMAAYAESPEDSGARF
ncbi:MAG: MotE family protein [Pseudomonadota bacterium]